MTVVDPWAKFDYETPFEISNPIYKITGTEKIHIGQFSEETGEKDAYDNKILVVAYTSTGSVKMPAGIAVQNKLEDTNVNFRRYGLGGLSGDIRQLYKARCTMYNAGSGTIPARGKISPHLSGVVGYTQDKVCVGEALEEIRTGTWGTVMVDLYMAKTIPITRQETITVTSNVGSLAKAPQQILACYGTGTTSGSQGFIPVPTGFLAGTGTVSVKFGVTGANCLVFDDDANVTSATVRYTTFEY